VIKFCQGNSRIRIDTCLLVDASDTLDRSHVEGVLKLEIYRVFRLDVAVYFFLLVRFVEFDELLIGEHSAALRDLGFLRLESFLEGLEVMPQPNATHSTR